MGVPIPLPPRIAGIDYRVRRSHWLPRRLGIEWFAWGQTLYGRSPVGPLPAHEFWHLEQNRKFGMARVVFHYLCHFFRNYLRKRRAGEAYLAIPFEVEARAFAESHPGWVPPENSETRIGGR